MSTDQPVNWDRIKMRVCMCFAKRNRRDVDFQSMKVRAPRATDSGYDTRTTMTNKKERK